MNTKGSSTDAIVETLDIFPTLCDLAGVEVPEFTQGVSLKDILQYPNASGHPAIAYKNNASTIRTETHRMILHEDGFVELYNHTTAEKETKNIADEYPELVEELKQEIKVKMQ
jgi:iduronate 2-sulfatase